MQSKTLGKAPPPTTFLRSHIAGVQTLCYLDDNTLLSGADDGQVKIWNLKRHRPVFELGGKLNERGILRLDVAGADKNTIICQNVNGSIKLWDKYRLLSGDLEPNRTIETEAYGFCQFAVSRWLDDCPLTPYSFLTSCSDSYKLLLWDIRAPTQCLELKMEKSSGTIMCCRFLSESARSAKSIVVVGTCSGCISFVELNTQAIVLQKKLHSESIMSIDIDKDLTQGVSCSSGVEILIWTINSALNDLVVIQSFNISSPGANCVEIRPDHKLVACAGWDGILRMYRWQKPVQLAALSGHEAGIKCIAFNPNSASGEVAAGSKDTRISLWHVYK